MKLKSIFVSLLFLISFVQSHSVFCEEQDNVYKASYRGDIDALKDLIKKGADINEPDFNGGNTLHSAVRGKQLKTIQFLIENKANLNQLENTGHSILDLSIGYEMEKIFLYLLDYEIPVDKKPEHPNFTPILCRFFDYYDIYPGSLEITKKLIKKGAMVNVKNGSRFIPFLSAVSRVKEDEILNLLKLLLENGADVNVTDKDGESALSYSIVFNKEKLVRFLVQNGADVNQKNSFQKIPLFQALKNKYSFPLFEFLISSHADINIQDTNGNTPLHEAFKELNLDAIQLLLKRGAMTDIKNKDGKTCFYDLYFPEKSVSPYPEQRKFLTKLKEHLEKIGYKNTLEVLLHQQRNESKIRQDWEQAKELNEKTRNTLFEAAVKGDLEKIQALLNRGNKVNEKAPLLHEYSALHYAVKNRQLKAAELLIKKGASVNAKDAQNKSPVFFAVDNNDSQMIQLLLKRGADINALGNGGETPLMKAVLLGDSNLVEFLLKSGAKTGIQNDLKRTEAHFAALGKNLDILNLLEKKKTDWQKKDHEGLTPLHLASCYSGRETVSWLISHGANLYEKDNQGNTPLHSAVSGDNLKAFEVLIEKGAILEIKNNAGITPVFLAHNDFPDGAVSQYLIRLGYFPSPDTARQKQLAREKAERKSTLIYGIILPVFYLGISVYSREKLFSRSPENNPFAYVNAFASCMIAGGFMGHLFASGMPASGSGMFGSMTQAINNELTGIAIGAIAGGILAGFTAKKFANNRNLYYPSTGFLVLIPMISFSW